jgi:hypothetical protein
MKNKTLSKAEAFVSPAWWEGCYQAFFGHGKGPQGSGYLALIRPPSGSPYFAIIAASASHRTALEIATGDYIDRGNALKPGTWCVVYGPCQEAACKCGGIRRGQDFFLPELGTIQ